MSTYRAGQELLDKGWMVGWWLVEVGWLVGWLVGWMDFFFWKGQWVTNGVEVWNPKGEIGW